MKEKRIISFIKTIRNSFTGSGHTQKSFAKLIQKSESYVKKLCAGDRKVQKWMVLLLECMIKKDGE